VGKTIWALDNGQWDMPELRQLLLDIIPQNSSFEDFRIEHQFPETGHQVLHLNARKIVSETGKEEYILLAIE
jgi:hypothetical protein